MPAVGKTTFAQRLAVKTRACLIDIDTATEPVVQAAMQRINGKPDDRDSPLFKETFRNAIYQALFAIADSNLPHTNAIVVGPFTQEMLKPDWPQQIQASLRTPCFVKCVFVHCDPSLRRQRLAERANPRDIPKLENWDEHLKYYELNLFPACPHFRVETDSEDCMEEAIRKGLLG